MLYSPCCFTINMKVHLPPALLRALYAFFSALLLPHPLMANDETVIEPPVGHFSGGGALLNGSYDSGIFADYSALSTSADVNITGAQEYAYLGNLSGGFFGMELMYHSTLQNTDSITITDTATSNVGNWGTMGIAQTSGGLYNYGTLNVSATSSYGEASGVYLRALYSVSTGELLEDSASNLVNTGVINAAAKTSVRNGGSVAYGLTAGAGDVLTNEGSGIMELSATAGWSNNNAGGNAAHALNLQEGASFDNLGALSLHASADNYGTACGISTSASFRNVGTVEINAVGDSYAAPCYAYGICLSSPTDSASTATLVNEAGAEISINATTDSSESQSYGVYAGASTRVVNDGTLSIEAASDYDTYGYYADSSALQNSGSMTILSTATDSYNAAYGIYAQSSTLTNSGMMKIGVTLYNSDNLEGYGIMADSATTITNYGTLDIETETPAYGTTYGISASVNNASGGTISVKSISTCQVAYGLKGALTNHGVVDIVAQNCEKAWVSGSGPAYGIAGDVVNGADGTLAVQASSVSTFAQGISGDLTNSGVAVVTVESIKNAYGLASGTTINEAGGHLTVQATTSAGGLTSGEAFGIRNTVVNRGTLEVSATASGTTRAYAIYSTSSITNEAGACMVLRADSNKTWAPYGIYSEGTFVNRGVVEIISSTADSSASSYGIYTKGTIVNEGSILIHPCTYGIDMREGGLLYNSGVMKLNSLYAPNTTEDSSLYLLNGSSVGAYTTGAELKISANSNPIFLGGALSKDGGIVTPVAGGSTVTISSDLSLVCGSLQLEDDVRLKMEGNLTIGGSCTVTRNDHILTVDNGEASRKVTVGTVVATEWDGAVALTTTTSGLISLSSEGGNTMSNGTLRANSIAVESVAGTTMILKDMVLTASGGDISLTNIEICGSCSLKSTIGTLTLNADGVTFVLDGSNSTGSGVEAQAFSLFSADPLTETQVASNIFYIDSDMLAKVNVAGNLTLDLSYWADDIAAGSYDSITFSFAEGMSFADGTALLATLNGADYAAADYMSGNVAQFSLLNLPTQVIPEPTTATLSLLALSALAARRRRQ